MNSMQPRNTAPPAPPAPPASPTTPPASPAPAATSWFSSLFGPSKPKNNLTAVAQGGRRRRGKKTHRKRVAKKTRKGRKGARRH